MTDSLNPWQPRWVQIESDQEDSLYEGMSVRIEGDEPETVVGIRSYDVDVDGDGYGNVTPTGVKVEEDGEWWSLHEVEFLAHQLDYGKARYEAKLIMRKATSRVTYRDGQPRYNGRMPVSPSVRRSSLLVSLNPYNPAVAKLVREAEAARLRWPSTRRGQAYFNALLALYPDIADTIRQTDDDPFHVDSKVPRFLTRVAELLEEA